MTDQVFWESRFSGEAYVFGKEPNTFLAAQAQRLRQGMVALVPADGEGRNSVWLAEQGLKVTATDFSETGIAKAKKLASERGVSVNSVLEDISQRIWEPEAFDVVAAIFIQFAGPELRRNIFDGMKKTLKPGGLLILQGYGPKQIEYGTGGPRVPENLYTRELLETAFQDLEILHLEEHDTVLNEGAGHHGVSALIDLVAQKRVL